MSSDIRVSLSSVAEIVSTKVSVSSLAGHQYVSTENLLPNLGSLGEGELPDAERVNSFKKSDTLFSNIRPYFRKVYYAPVGGGCSADVLVFRTKDPQEFWPPYLYYCLADPTFIDHTMATSKGAKMPRGDKGAMLQYQVFKPDLETQKKVSSLLRSLDESILTLQRQNTTLEAIAQRLFRSWFVNFDPVHAKAAGREPEAMSAELAALFPSEFEESALGLIPKGWSATTFGDAFHINPRRSLSKAFMAPHLEMASVSTAGHRPSQRLPLRAFSSGTKYINGDTLLARITPCLENGKTAFVDFLKPNEVGWGSTEFIVIRSKDGCPQLWSYLLARQKQFRTFAIKAMTGTSGRQRVDVSTLKTYKLAMPPVELAIATVPVFDSINKQMTINAEISLVLAELRDHLLPRLISGKLSLADAEAVLAAVKPEVEQA